jgi:hypothetical protein
LLEDIGAEADLGDKHLSFDMCRWTSTLMDYREGFDIESAKNWAFPKSMAEINLTSTVRRTELKNIERKNHYGFA